jgi:hypothetical protein
VDASDVQLWGSSDDDYFTVEGDLRIPIRLEGRGGQNRLTLDEDFVDNQPTYTLYESRPGVLPNRLRREYGDLDIDIRHAGMTTVTVNANSAVGGNFLIRGVPLGTRLVLNGGYENFWSLGSGLGHMNGFLGDIEIHGGSSGQDYVVMSDLNNNDTTMQTSFTVTNDRVERIRTGHFFGGPNNIVRIPIVDILGIDLSGIYRVDITGSHTRPTRFNIQSNTLNRLFIIGGRAGDTVVVGNSTNGLGSFFPRSHTSVFGLDVPQRLSFHGGGGQDSLVFNDFNGPFHAGTVAMDYTFSEATPLAEINEPTTRLRREVTEEEGAQDGSDTVIVRKDIDEFLFSDIEDVQLYGAAYSGTNYAIAGFGGSRATDKLTVHSYLGSDHFWLGTAADGLDKIKAAVVLDDAGGTDDLHISGHVVYLDDGKVTAPGNFNTSYGNVESIDVSTNAGNTRVEVRGTPQDVPVTVFGARQVNVGTGTLANIKGPISIWNSSPLDLPGQPFGNALTALTVDDSADPLPSTLVIGLDAVSAAHGTSPFVHVDFSGADLSSLTVSGGSGGNQLTLEQTRDSSSIGPVTLNSGTGGDIVTIERSNVPVTVNGQAGADTVHLGASGSVQAILGQVTVSNLGNWSTLNIDNSNDTLPRTVTMDVGATYGTMDGLAPARIRYRQRDVRALNVWGGSGNNRFDILNTVLSTIPEGSPTTLFAGAGLDTVNVVATTGPLTIDPQNNDNQITLGSRTGQSGDLGRLRGEITLIGQPGASGNFVDIVDRFNPGQFDYLLEAQRFHRTNPDGTQSVAMIRFDSLAIDGLDLFGANGSSRYSILGTPHANSAVVGGGIGIIGGRNDDQATILGSSSDLFVALGGGASQSVSIGDAAHVLDAIGGNVRVSGRGLIHASVSDEASATTKIVTIDHVLSRGHVVERYDFNPINGSSTKLNVFEFDFVDSGRLSFQAGQSGTAGYYNQINVYGTAPNTEILVSGGPDYDIFTVGFGADASRVKGPVSIVSPQADIDLAFFHDYFNPQPQTYTVRTNPVNATGVLVERPGLPAVTYDGLTQLIFYSPQVGGNSTNIQGVPANLYLNMPTAHGDRVTIGSSAPTRNGTLDTIAGPVALSSYSPADAVTLVIDDSGNTTSARHATIVPYEASGPWGLITGLTGSSLLFRDYPNWNVEIRAGTRDDRIVMSGNPLAASIVIDGGPGNDVLIGSGGNLLRGGTGRNLLIAGALPSRLEGGTDEDILIGGSLRDPTDRALDVIMAVWTGDSEYATRVFNLLAGELHPENVIGNGGGNTLLGDDGLDLYLASLGLDSYVLEDEETVAGI